MDKLEQITELVSDLGLKPGDVVKYWQDRGLLSAQKTKKILQQYLKTLLFPQILGAVSRRLLQKKQKSMSTKLPIILLSERS